MKWFNDESIILFLYLFTLAMSGALTMRRVMEWVV
jgi:hypothetical protein